MVFRDYQDILKNALIAMAREIVQERDVYRLKVLRRVFDAYEDILKRLKHMFAFLVKIRYNIGSPIHNKIRQNRITRQDRHTHNNNNPILLIISQRIFPYIFQTSL